MGGKPAVRQGDMTRKGLDIVQGSAGVLIGAPTGVACSVCPGGITYANPVNPLLGAKVLPGETDLALPGPLPFILSRAYSSYRTRTPAPVGVFGPGWKAPFDIRLQIRDEGLILNDNGGRSIHFEPLFPGEISYSRSESLWLARGGVAEQHSSQPLSALWQVLPEDVRLSPHVYLATNSLQGPWWILSWPERVPGADEVLPPEPPAYRVLTGVVDGFGRTLAFHRAAEGDVAGAVTGVTDGAGRRFHLVLTTQAQRAEVFRKQRATSLSSPAGPRSASSSLVFPDTLPAGTGYGTDNGIRLEAVWLTHDPAYPDEQPTAPLARYTYTASGELRAVYDRSGTQARGFTYDAEHAGRMVAHHYAGRPESRYRYDDTGRVTEQVNPEGLDYRFEYGERRVIITDSLNRREVLYTEGEGGLKRVVKKEHADGSITRSEYDEAGRLAEKTDLIPEGVIRMHDERTHHYHYDSQHRLVFYTRIQHGEPQVESRYLYDPLGRRTGKRVWRRERDLTGWMSLSRKPEVTWYGWDGDRLTTVQTQQTRIQTVYQPGSFTPLLRIETENGEQAKARHRSLAEVLQEDTGVTLPAELAVMLGRLERELRQGSVSEESQQWLAQCGLTAEQMAAQLEAEYIPERKLHLYHCDHRGLPLALISPEGETAWQGEYDEWGNLLGETSAQQLQQPYRLPGQQYDEESGLYYNRNRYYDPLQGRYITQDPIGLRGEWNLYKYPLNPVRFIDSLGLKFHVNGDPSDFNQAVEYLKQDSQMKETIDFLSSSEETINIEYIEGTNVRFNSNNMTIYWNSRASLFCSTELNSKSQSPALGLGHEFAHAQYYLLDKENFMALLSRTDKKYENKEEARVITIIESRAAKTLGECTRGAHSGLPFYRVDGPLQTMKITGTPE
ncbi:RHS repeat protein [Escherichia coli]|uniref:RHS repeat-associated core domain-containing protein n=1 Tax=Escherichia coli TaxID=562 RepID=UPI00028CAAA4|nr:RHS repeat-associated core domain-containing protein [Escherichia coli]EEW1921938.1 RHS repeat protein [Escherichia coli]EFD0463029.1 RHS repeat protein [Escherichia coli]EFD9246977.1 RHS repeat protein [Escherichia coli]EFD9671948.1 RHS repeat protein [Escherichia coli]EFL5889946.1 RHS repeat protein [Escherichia coli]